MLPASIVRCRLRCTPPHRWGVWCRAIGLTAAALATTWLAEPGVCTAEKNPPSFEPVIEAASAQAEKAITGFSLPKPFTVELFAAEPMLANPVALSIDPMGRVFVVESFRYGNNPQSTKIIQNGTIGSVCLRTPIAMVGPIARQFLPIGSTGWKVGLPRASWPCGMKCC